MWFHNPPEDELTVYSGRQELWLEVERLRALLDEAEENVRREINRTELALSTYVVAGKSMLVITGGSERDIDSICSSWAKIHPECGYVALPEGMSISTLDNEDLASIGLKRVSRGPITSAEEYDAQIIECSG